MGGSLFGAAVTLITILIVIVGLPCVAVAWLGSRMINKLGYFPSKNPAIQTSIFLQLLVIEIFSFTLLFLFYHVFVDYSKGG